MEPHFVIRDEESRIEYNFITSQGKDFFKWMEAPDADTADANIKKIRRRRDPRSFKISIKTLNAGDKFYFCACDEEGQELFCSLLYSSLQRVKGGREFLVREMYEARIYDMSVRG